MKTNTDYSRAVYGGGKRCANCVHMRERTPKDKLVEKERSLFTKWCDVAGIQTNPGLCRCGGDDFKEKGN